MGAAIKFDLIQTIRQKFGEQSLTDYAKAYNITLRLRQFFCGRNSFSQKNRFLLKLSLSSPDKIELLEKARRFGYGNYLYFVSTDDTQINVSRVEIRFNKVCHGFPAENYDPLLLFSGLGFEAIKHTNRAFIFDNSCIEVLFPAEIIDAESLELKVASVPHRFEKYVMDKNRLSY